MKQLKLGFLGFGLIGGSIARSLKAKQIPITTLVYSRRQNAALEQGVKDGIIDELVYQIDEHFSTCDIIFLCAPVLTNINLLKTLKSIINENCIITDVGSVKGSIHAAATSLDMEKNFIGGHPMAGSEKTGYENSTTTLLENAYYLLTPTPKTTQDHLTLMQDLVKAVGSICVVIDADTHDNITAAISHVPHIIASSLVNMVRLHDDSEEHMRNFAAGGFKDITRIASSSPDMWKDICLTNTKSIRHFLHQFCNVLNDFDQLLEHKESAKLRESFEDAGNYRDSLPSRNTGMITRCYEVFVDLADETGAIASIATILAAHGVSIKNIGIIHNREFADGVLRIELYEEDALQKAINLLKNHHYHTIIR